MPTAALRGFERLHVSPAVRRDLAGCLTRIVEGSRQPPVSITLFGSAVTGGYEEATSDLNVLVVYEELELPDLEPLAESVRRCFEKHRFSTRFLSRRNLVESARYFQVDLLAMRASRLVVHGEDVLENLPVSPEDLRWQLAHEVKRMRMRLKQQFWWTAGRPKTRLAVVLNRFSSLVHLHRAALVLEGRPIPADAQGAVGVVAQDLGMERTVVDRIRSWKAGAPVPREEELTGAYREVFNAVRALDERVGRIGA